MSEDVFAQKLDWFKQNERPEVVLLVADNPELIKIIVAWSNTTVDRAEPATTLSTDSENRIWEWLWENVVFCEEELTAKSGQSRYRLDQELKKLIGNRILYPDGTVNSFVLRYLREKVLGLFNSRTKKQRSTAAAK